MATKTIYICDYCGKKLKYKGDPLEVTIATLCPHTRRRWAELCQPCIEHIAKVVEEALDGLGDNCA